MALFVAGTAFLALMVLWLVLVAFATPPPQPPRQAVSYRHQRTENPDWFPGHAGGAGT